MNSILEANVSAKTPLGESPTTGYVSDKSNSVTEGSAKSRTVTANHLYNEIAMREDMDIAIVRKVFSAAEEIIIDYLSSITSTELTEIKLMPGIKITGELIPERIFSRGSFQGVFCPEKIKVSVKSNKSYERRANTARNEKKEI